MATQARMQHRRGTNNSGSRHMYIYKTLYKLLVSMKYSDIHFPCQSNDDKIKTRDFHNIHTLHTRGVSNIRRSGSSKKRVAYKESPDSNPDTASIQNSGPHRRCYSIAGAQKKEAHQISTHLRHSRHQFCGAKQTRCAQRPCMVSTQGHRYMWIYRI